MKPVLRVPDFESESPIPDGTEEEQRKWISEAIVDVIDLAELLPYEPTPQHDRPARPIHR